MAENLSASLLPTLRDLAEWLRATHTPYVLIGGVAVSMVGRARITQDVDAAVVIDDDKLDAFIESGAKFGFAPRVADPVRFAQETCMLLMAHKEDGVRLDIALAKTQFEQDAIKHAVPFSAGGINVCVPRVEDLIIMKAVSGRGIDLADIDTLLDMNPRADRRRIRRLARVFAEGLENPEIAERLDPLLAKRRVPLLKKKRQGKHK